MSLCHDISDVDECFEELDNCSTQDNRICKNTIGEFDCICDDGYEENGNGMCIGERKYLVSNIIMFIIILMFASMSDIDECFRQIDLCEQNCTNTPGSYVCGCDTGYNESGFNCIGKDS